MKICIISPRELPVPAIKGGAVETLITEFIEQNEINKKLDIDIVTIFDKENLKILKNYKYANFIMVNFDRNIFFKSFKFFNKIFKTKFFNKCFNKLKFEVKKYMYNQAVIKRIQTCEYDFVITECGASDEYERIYKYIKRLKSVMHVHGHINGTEKLEKKFEYFLGVSKFVNSELVKNRIIPKERTKLLYNGIKLEDFDKHLSNEEIKRERKNYAIKDNEKIIVFCGRTVKDKGVKELILAYKKIYKECNAKLMIVGNSNFANQVVTDYDRELVEISKDIKDRIIFAGHIYNKDLYRIYSIADIAVFPHLWEEAFGLVFVEAMASGVPLIVTKSGAVPEIVEEDCGIILEKDDKEKLIDELAYSMKKLLNDYELRRRMGDAGRKKAKNFSSQNYYHNFVKILEELKKENENRNINISKCS